MYGLDLMGFTVNWFSLTWFDQPPLFHFCQFIKKINVLNLVFGNIIWPPPSFFYHCFVYFLKQMFSAFPYFLSFLSVFIGLMFSDIIWPPPFFIILYPIITRSKFSYFLHFLSVFMCLLFSDIIWPPPFFFNIIYLIITR